jgi:hypothetical protein
MSKIVDVVIPEGSILYLNGSPVMLKSPTVVKVAAKNRRFINGTKLFCQQLKGHLSLHTL